jgi:DNA-binding NarL/FixJ family response regulator
MSGEGQPRPIRVVLAEDHIRMRRSLRLLLDSEHGVLVVAEAADIPTAARHVLDHRPQVLVLDMGMAAQDASAGLGRSGLELTSFVRTAAPETQVVLMTMQEHPGLVRRALEAGAVGLVRKDLAESELPEAVRAAASGAVYARQHLSGRR